MLLFQSIGKSSEWAATAGINGQVLFALCSVMIILIGLLAWYVKEQVKSSKEDRKNQKDYNNNLVKIFGSIKEEMYRNALKITEPMVESNLRHIDIQTDISEVKRNQTELAALIEVEMSKVTGELKNVSNHLEIFNETVKKVYKNN